jgi:predicted SAM-dependent methyltransferase
MNTERVAQFISRHPNIRVVYLAIRGMSNAMMRRNPFQRLSRRVRTLDYLNIGCNKKIFEHTINLDYAWFPGIDLTFDILRPLPISEKSLRGIYCEHVIEHLPFDTVPFILSEWKRVLRPGGVVRILVPDAQLYVETYCSIKKGEKALFPYHNVASTPMMQVNEMFRSYEHQYAYDYETLARLLDEAGFKGITQCEHKKGRDEKLLLDSEDRRAESLRIEALLPE